MIRFIIAIITLVAGLILGTELAGKKGYVLVALEEYTYETTVTTAIVGVLLLFFIMQLIEWFLIRILRLNASTRRWLAGIGRRKSESVVAKGFIALASGDYKRASSLLSKGASRSVAPEISLLAAAVAAQWLKDPKQKNRFLRLAEVGGAHQVPVLVTKAKLCIADHDYQQAADILDELTELKVSNPAVLELKQVVYLAMREWKALLSLLPELKKAGVVDEKGKQNLLITAYQGRFTDLLAQQGGQAGETLAALWNGLPRKDKKMEGVRLAICDALIKGGDSQAAYQILGDLISKEPNTPYLQLLPLLELNDYYPVLEQLDRLSKKYQTPELHSVYGRLLLKAQKWQQAIDALSLALSIRETTEDHLALAQANEHLGHYKKAIEHYAKVCVNREIIPIV